MPYDSGSREPVSDLFELGFARKLWHPQVCCNLILADERDSVFFPWLFSEHNGEGKHE
jgi:hypothetical protein